MKEFIRKSLLLSLFLLSHLSIPSSSTGSIMRSRYNQHERLSKKKVMFVFGDSYADTGNWNNVASCWKQPYGITFPGKPAGRFSDGRILTDYIASYLKIRSPIPYERRNSRGGSNKLKYGMNFAYGGTGVFDTDVSKPNMTTQINMFEQLISQGKIYTKSDLQYSVALVSLGGNDYSNYLKHGSKLSLKEFMKSVVNQLVLDLQHIHDIGVAKIVVTAMEPLGCLPVITSFLGYNNCSESLNNVTLFHNQLLQTSVEALNKKNKANAFFVLDLYGAFLSVLRTHKYQPGNNLLKPCCEGTTGDYGCGSTEGGEPKYTVCAKPNLAFFWDTVHLTQNGWYQVYLAFKSTLRNLL